MNPPRYIVVTSDFHWVFKIPYIVSRLELYHNNNKIVVGHSNGVQWGGEGFLPACSSTGLRPRLGCMAIESAVIANNHRRRVQIVELEESAFYAFQ